MELLLGFVSISSPPAIRHSIPRGAYYAFMNVTDELRSVAGFAAYEFSIAGLKGLDRTTTALLHGIRRLKMV